jgi:uncharacterized protein (DUF488 family)
MAPTFVTIGVYGYTEEVFFQTLRAAYVDHFVDIRRRRALRGTQYAFANSNRLQPRLAALGIRYLHRLDLAPSNATRQIQAIHDRLAKTARRQRSGLAPAFVAAYERECLAGFDAEQFLIDLGPDAKVVALFCVEREPAACHRSLVAARLSAEGLTVSHLLP